MREFRRGTFGTPPPGPDRRTPETPGRAAARPGSVRRVSRTPPLTTERLVLRPAATADHAVLLAHWTAPDVRRFLFDGAAPTAAEVAAAIDDGLRPGSGHALWLAHERGPGGAFAGTAGLRPLDDLGTEVVYSLAPTHWGRGYATEAAGAVVAHALGPLGLPYVLAEVDAGNTASAAVVTRLGMTPFATVPGLLGPMTRYRLDAPSG